MSQTTIIAIAAIVVIALLVLLYLIRGRKQHVGFGEAAPVARAAPAAPAPTASPPLERSAVAAPEGHGVGSEVTAAIEDVIDQFIGLDAHPSGRQQPPTHTGDPLTRLKGLGPRVATRLAELGVTRFDQIAAWDDSDVAAIDAQMGTFKGRITRDRWVEQARLLAGGEQDAFEERFGKLGG